MYKSNEPPKTSKGLYSMIALLVLMVVLVLGLAFVSKNMSNNGQVMTYEDCTKHSGSLIQESYPEVCVTKSGQRFVNPNQQVGCYRTGWESNPELCK